MSTLLQSMGCPFMLFTNMILVRQTVKWCSVISSCLLQYQEVSWLTLCYSLTRQCQFEENCWTFEVKIMPPIIWSSLTWTILWGDLHGLHAYMTDTRWTIWKNLSVYQNWKDLKQCIICTWVRIMWLYFQLFLTKIYQYSWMLDNDWKVW